MQGLASCFEFVRFAQNRNNRGVASPGGLIYVFTAAATLLTGDVVYISAANTVAKSATAANLAGFAGVVVGGRATGYRPITESGRTGITAALVGQEVFVQRSGIVRVVADGVVTVGTTFSVIGATTSGRVIAGITAGLMVGVPIGSAAGAGSEFLMLISHR